MKIYNKDYIKKKFSKFGELAEKEVALVFAYKKEKRLQDKNKLNAENVNFYSINHKELEEFYNCIEAIAEIKKQQQKDFKIQFAFKKSGEINIPIGHWVFGEVYFNFANGNNSIKFFLCDPSSGHFLLEKYFVSEGSKIHKLANKYQIELYFPNNNIKLQHLGLGCSYFAIDSAFLLSTQDKFENLYEYIVRNHSNVLNRNGIITVYGELPIRLMRSKQSIQYFVEIFTNKPELMKKIVDKSDRTAGNSIVKDIVYVGKKPINNRIKHKMDKYRQILTNYVENKTDHEIAERIKDRRIDGLKKFVNELKSKQDKKQKPKLF